MSDKKNISYAVSDIIADLKKNASARFSKSDFQILVYGILSDPDFKAKKYLLRNDAMVEEENDIGAGLRKFLDKLLKHAGVNESVERSRIIEEFEYTPRDVEWIVDAVDEAMYQYTECDKNMRLFRDKMRQLTIRKMVRSGKYNGKITYKKIVVDRALAIEKRSKSN